MEGGGGKSIRIEMSPSSRERQGEMWWMREIGVLYTRALRYWLY